MAEDNYYQENNDQESSSLKLKDWINICISKWYWFLISFIVFFGLAYLYILKTPPVYTRQASILIKDDDKNSSISSQFGKFSDFGINGGKTNLYNEMITLKSPTYMLDVVKTLHLDMNYVIKGTFHDIALYGKSLPISVVLPDLNPEDIAGFSVKLGTNNSIILDQFYKNEKQIDKTVKGHLGEVIQSPIGKILIAPTQSYIGKYDEPIMVSKVGLSDITKMYSGELKVELNDDNSSVVDIRLDDENPQRAEDILNNIYIVYNKKWIEDINQQAISTSQFIDDELRTIESELGNVDEDISSYKSQHLVPDVQTASQLYMNKAEETNAKILELNNQLFMAKYIYRQLTKESGRFQLLPANSGIDNSSVSQQIVSYNERLLRRNNLVANSSPTNPIVLDLDQDLAASRNAIIASINNVIATLNDKLSGLQQREQTTKSEIASNPSQAKYLLSVERQQKVKEQLYLFLLQKREENQLSKAFTAYNTKMLNPPAGSKLPTKPVKFNIFLVSLLFGLFVPMLIIVIINNLDTAVRGRRDLDKLSIPFIGEIPLSYKKRRGLFALFTKKKEIREIVVHEKSKNEINEAFRVVRTNLEFVSGKEDRTKTIMFTSANAGSGKTFITMNLATSFAIKGKRILVIDLDLRKASLSTFIKSPNIGIADYLNEKKESIDEVILKGKVHENLDFIPEGTIPPNPTELLFSDRLENSLQQLKRNYDYIFIDCPPVEIVADASIVTKLCDMTVFIIRSGLLDRSALPEIEKYYTEKRYKNLVTILNGTVSESGYGYHRYGYSYGYSYGY